MSNAVIEHLTTRASVPIQLLAEPAPGDDEIALILRAATRVPDHGKLEPWRFIIYRGAAREEVGRLLAKLAEEREGPLSDARREQELTRFSRAPLVIGVVSVLRDHPKIPQWEMSLSGAAVAMNVVHAANALGYRTNWITNWYSDVPEGRRLLGLSPDERVVGFVHVGSYAGEVPERPRPEVADLVSDYAGPWTE